MRVVVTVLLFACGTKPAPAPVVANEPKTFKPPTRESAEETEDAGVEVETDQGIIADAVTRREFDAHSAALQACYLDGLAGRNYIFGDITIEWVVAPDGAMRSVYLYPNDLGDWTMEQCLLERARMFNFGKPKGKGEAHIDMTMQFAVEPADTWDEAATREIIAEPLKAAQKKCKDGKRDTEITFYIQHGKVLGSGFARKGDIPAAWASCIQGEMALWSFANRKRATKLNFTWSGN